MYYNTHMPILEYVCPVCGKIFEELVRSHEEEVLCPDCHVPAGRRWSGCMHSATGKPVRHCSGNCKTCSGCH